MKIQLDQCVYRKARLEDSADLLAWRNDEATRANSLNTDLIDETSHSKWFLKAISDEKMDLLIYECNDQKIGTVRLSYSLPNCELSWTINPKFRGMGFSKSMVAKSLKYLNPECQYLTARVRLNNLASVKIAEYLGMTPVAVENDVIFFRKEIA